MNNSDIFKKCVIAQQKAHGKISVGAVCVALNGGFNEQYFSGSNLHVSDSFADVHAEQLAVNLALLDGYYPTEIFVTSQSKEEDVRLCGSCRHYISEINNDCIITVFNPDGTVKSCGALNTVYPYSKDVVEKNKRFRKMCGFHED